MSASRRSRLTRDHAEQTYIRAGELEVFRQLQRDATALDEALPDSTIAVGPFSRLRADLVVDDLGKTRGAINNLWGSQEGFRSAVMSVFLNDVSLGLDDVDQPDPEQSPTVDDWIQRWAEAEIERGPQHGMAPQNRYGLRWAAWLGLVPYGVWSDAVAAPSIEEFRAGVTHLADEVLRPAFAHFELTVAEPATIHDLAVAASSLIEGSWLNAALSPDDPIDRDRSIAARLATSLQLLVRGATAG